MPPPRSDLQTLLTGHVQGGPGAGDHEAISRPSTTYTSLLQFYYRSRMTFEEFSQIADKLTTSSETTLPGLVNVNTASKEVLMCLPGLEEKDVDDLMAYRTHQQRQ